MSRGRTRPSKNTFYKFFPPKADRQPPQYKKNFSIQDFCPPTLKLRRAGEEETACRQAGTQSVWRMTVTLDIEDVKGPHPKFDAALFLITQCFYRAPKGRQIFWTGFLSIFNIFFIIFPITWVIFNILTNVIQSGFIPNDMFVDCFGHPQGVPLQ